MTKTKKILPALVLLLSLSLGAMAQETSDGRKVKRITFDREQVNIEYADGTADTGVDVATIKRDDALTAIQTAKSEGSQSARQWYTIDGRALQSAPQRKGVYIERKKNGVRKTIKK